jgi:hypothetical protein
MATRSGHKAISSDLFDLNPHFILSGTLGAKTR